MLPGFGMSLLSPSSWDWAVPQEHPRSVRFCIALSLIYKGSAVLSALRSGAACHGNIHPGLKKPLCSHFTPLPGMGKAAVASCCLLPPSPKTANK